MKKKYILILSISILLITISAIFVYLSKDTNKTSSTAIDAVPISAVFILESNNFQLFIHSLTHENKNWAEMCVVPEINQAQQSLVFLDSLLENNPSLKVLFNNHKVFTSFHVIGKNSIEIMNFVSIKNITNESKIEDLASEICADCKSNITEHENINIYSYTFQDKDVFHFAVCNDVLIIGQSLLLVQESIRQMHQNINFAQEKTFTRLSKTANQNASASIYINFKRVPFFLKSILNNQLYREINQISSITSWAQFDIKIREDVILLNGFSSPKDTITDFLNIFSNQSPRKSNMDKILPANTKFFIQYNISDFKKFNEDLLSYLDRNNEKQKYTALQQSIKNRFGESPVEIVNDIFDGELAYAIADFNSSDTTDNEFIILKTNSGSVAISRLAKMVESASQQNNNEPYKVKHQIDRQISYDICKMPFRGFVQSVFGPPFGEKENSWFVAIDNYLVFGNSPKALINFIQQTIIKRTLNTDHYYQATSNYLSAQFNIMLYVNNTGDKSIFNPLLNKQLNKIVATHKEAFQKTHSIALQLSSTGDMLYNNLAIHYLPEIKQKAQTVWESLLDTTINVKPAMIDNHISHEKEIFVQDLKKNVYLINKSGRIVWKIQLNEIINSEIYQVDYFRNGKLQLLFSTPNAIHLLDINGNYMDKYPIQLRSTATAGVTLIDYDKNKDYRMLIPCEDKSIYNYTKDGKLLKGWNFRTADNPISKPIQYFKVNGNDYLIAIEKYKVHILNRKGEPRISPSENISISENNMFHFDANNSNPRFVTTDSKGQLISLYLNGKVTRENLKSYNSTHYFQCFDITGDGRNEFLYVDENKIDVFKDNLKPLFSKKLSNSTLSSPNFFIFSSDNKKIGLVDYEKNEIYLVNSDGSVYQGFPLKGNTPFSISIFKQNKTNFNLIVGSKDNFLYNYTLQ